MLNTMYQGNDRKKWIVEMSFKNQATLILYFYSMDAFFKKGIFRVPPKRQNSCLPRVLLHNLSFWDLLFPESANGIRLQT